ncbi:hypothetical protein ICA_04991 [Bacillus cereus BAG1O-3]|uniref:insulinase family protein n=1 Tax=Bacillus TaxID=1386 RepID=UPI0003544BC1|nr:MULTISPECIES: pitrilysin family protein [Bacillus]EPF08890.1 hypothetical protein ICA_04991 [Bacillus cereus BAG1O-3]MDR4414385.1 insulinase family protein [Bacillus thuringiensis]PFG78855.1 putative Zn-dependent peptidase [Bacillus sp. YF23]
MKQKIIEKKVNILESNMNYVQLENGFKILFIQSPEQKQHLAMLTVSCGSYFNQYLDEDLRIKFAPSGIAHFLEHMLFDHEDGKLHEKFATTSTLANAFTSYDKTSYWISTIGDLKEAIKILLYAVFNPNFNTDMVDREKKVIKQEISMYKTNLDYQSDLRLMSLIKGTSQFDILGNISDVDNITAEQLYRYHHTYYQPNNMCLTVMGDFEIESNFNNIHKQVSTLLHNFKTDIPIEKLSNTSFNMVNNEETIRVGWGIPLSNSESVIEWYLIYRIGFEALFGERSMFSYELQKNGDIFEPVEFRLEYINEEFYLILEMKGQCTDNIKKYIIKYFNKIKANEIDHSIFNNQKRQIYGDWVHKYDDPPEFIYDINELFNLNLNIDIYMNELMTISESKILKSLQKTVNEKLFKTII